MASSVELLEREAELEELEEALAAAAAGSGRLLLIEGPAGIGKSALLEAAGQKARDADFRRLRARATEIESGLPYGTVRQLFEPALRAASADERTGWLAGAAAPAAAVLGAADAPAPPAPDPGILHALYWLLAAIAEAGPCLLVVDDAQWADEDSLRFLSFLSPRLPELAVLVVVAARAGDATTLGTLAATASDPGSRPSTPALLSAAATAEVAARHFDDPVDPEFARACHEATGGNPFYLRTLLEVLRGDGVMPRAESAERALSLGPRTVTRATIARVAKLSPAAAPVLRSLAVLGDGADVRHVARLAEVDEPAAREAVDGLASMSIVAAESGIGFTHPILRNATYADVGPSERAELHRRAAALLADDGIDPGRVAAHLLAVAPRGSAEVVTTLRAAATEALVVGAPSVAVARLRRALEEPPAPEQRVPVLVELGMAELAVDGAAAVEHLRAALADIRDPAGRPAVARGLAQAWFSAGDSDAGLSTLRSELELAEDPEEARALEVDLIVALATALDRDLVREADERIERLAAGLEGATPGERTALDCLAFCRLRAGGPVAEVVAPARTRIERTSADEVISPIHLLMTAGTLTRCDELDLAEVWAQRALGAARAGGSVFGMGAGHWLVGAVAHRRGALVDAVSNFETALRQAQEYGAGYGIQSSVTGLVDVQIDRGALDEALDAMAGAGLDTGVPEAISTAGELLQTRGRLHLARGDADTALRDFAAAAELFRDRGDPGPGISSWRVGAARAHLRRGEKDDAREVAWEALERARRFGAPGALGCALRVAAETRGGAEGVELLREAVGVSGESADPLERARALVALGAALRRSGERTAARDHLSDGFALARSCGAVPLAENAYTELRAAGARPRKVLRTGVEALTPSEARVAKLAAAGMSNREIAQELFVTPKTVEFHLGQTYRKLEISSRGQLSGALSP